MENETNWSDLIFTVPKTYAQQAQDIATAYADGGLYIEDYSDLETQVWEIAHVDLIEEELQQKPRDIVKLHLYFPEQATLLPTLDAIQNQMMTQDIPFSYETQNVREEDWANEWKKHYHTFEIAQRLAIVPSWEDYTGTRIPLLIDPGMAFGTGTHETTFLCLEALDELVTGGEAVLDIGTGSGILGIAATLLGAGEALGIDIDPVAVKTANENARRNQAAPRFTAKAGDLALGVSGSYNIITANIIADAIIALSPEVPGLLAPGGVFVSSGIINHRSEDVRQALEGAGFQNIEERRKKDWVLFIARR